MTRAEEWRAFAELLASRSQEMQEKADEQFRNGQMMSGSTFQGVSLALSCAAKDAVAVALKVRGGK